MRGERAADYGRRRQFEQEQKDLMLSAERFALANQPREIPVACCCSFRPYPHILIDEISILRHRRGEAR